MKNALDNLMNEDEDVKIEFSDDDSDTEDHYQDDKKEEELREFLINKGYKNIGNSLGEPNFPTQND